MTINGNLLARLGLIAITTSLVAACVAMVPTPSQNNANTQGSAATVSLCNIEGQQEQDLSDGSTVARISQSCEETVIYLENQHKEHPKRCRVVMGGQTTGLYIMPGENRTLTQSGPVQQNTVKISCVNDWNRTK